jgi:hypothetical protein
LLLGEEEEEEGYIMVGRGGGERGRKGRKGRGGESNLGEVAVAAFKGGAEIRKLV